MARCRRADGRLFARPARISGWITAVLCPLIWMSGYAAVAQIRCCTGSGPEWTGYAAMGLLSIAGGMVLASIVAILVECLHRLGTALVG